MQIILISHLLVLVRIPKDLSDSITKNPKGNLKILTILI